MLPRRHFDVLLADDAPKRTIQLIRQRYEARYPPAEVLILTLTLTPTPTPDR